MLSHLPNTLAVQQSSTFKYSRVTVVTHALDLKRLPTSSTDHEFTPDVRDGSTDQQQQKFQMGRSMGVACLSRAYTLVHRVPFRQAIP